MWERGLRVYRICKDVLSQFGAEPLAFTQGGGEERFFDWIDREFQFLSNIIKTFGDYAALVCFSSVTKILEDEGCDHILKMGRSGFKFGPATSPEEAFRNVKVIRARFMKEFQAVSCCEAARKIASDLLAKVYSFTYFYTFFLFADLFLTFFLFPFCSYA